jgi:PAS domain S-box-containing protein
LPRFPGWRLAAALAVSTVAVYFIFSQSKSVYRATSESSSSYYGVLDSAGTLLTLDSKVTMAATLAAVTGEAQYFKEHEKLALELGLKIKAAGGHADRSGGVAYAAGINEANLKLLDIEKRALALAKAGRGREASGLLVGKEYLDLKKTYSRNVSGLLDEFQRAHLAEGETWRAEIVGESAAAVAASALALLLWAFFAVYFFRWMRSKGSVEELVAEKDEEIRHFFDTVQEIFYRADWKGRITDITPSIFRYSGFTREELIGIPVSNLYVNPADRLRLVKAILSKGIIEDYEVKLKTKDRGPLDILVNARLLKGFGGVPLGIEGSLRDITVRKAAEKRLERMNRLYTLLSGVNEAVVRIHSQQKLFEEVCRIAVEVGGIKFAWVGIAGEDGKVRPVARYGEGAGYLDEIIVNTDAATPEGRGPTAVAAREGRVVINSDSERNPVVAPWRESLLKYGFHSSAAFPIAGTGAVAFYAGETGFFMEDEERLLASLAEDITYAVNSIRGEQAQAETASQLEHAREQLRQSQKMEAVGRLAGGIAHDFNNMLTAILSYAGFLRDGLDPADPRRGDAEEILAAAEKASRLTRQLLAFSRRQVLMPRVISLDDTIKSTEAMLKRLIGEHIDFVTRLSSGIANIKADPGQVEQILVNLAVNARDAITGPGKIIVETAALELLSDTPGRHDIIPPGRYVRLIVSDTGSGMGQDTLSHIFEPFFTTKELGKGTGLGLSTVYGIVKQSGGYVWVYSEPGKGTSFKIYFPEVRETASGAAGDAPSPPPAGGTETLVLAEDDAQVRAAIARILGEAGYKVITAQDGVEALALGAETIGRASLLITDLMMPNMGGMELSAAVRKISPGLPVLYISGYSEELVSAGEMLGPGCLFMQKPVDTSTLLKKVREAIGGAGRVPA